MNNHFAFFICANLVKLFLTASDLFGRFFLWIQKYPPVGEFKKDLSYGENSAQKADLLLPKNKTDKPGIIYIHGGGWLVGDKASYNNMCAQWVQDGHPIVNINYRLGPRFHYPEQISDINSAIKFAQNLFREHGFNADQLILAGDSAGAHLACWYAAALNKPELAAWAKLETPIPAEMVRCLLLIYGAYDLEKTYHSGFRFIKTFYASLLGTNPTQEEIFNLSPLHQLNKKFPPAFIFGLENDALYGETLALIDKLDSLHLSHQDCLVKKGQYKVDWHGFINHKTPFAEDAMQAMRRYLAETCK